MKNKPSKFEKYFYIIITLAYLFTWSLGSGPVLYGDSPSYKNPTITNDYFQLWRSITGDWYRTPSVVVPFELAGENLSITVVQFSLALLANIAIIFSLYRYFQGKKIATIASIAVTMLLLSNNIVSWNWTVLSEGLGISYTVFAISMFILALKRIALIPVSLFILFSFLAGMTRLTLYGIFILMAGILVWKLLSNKRNLRVMFATIAGISVFTVLFSVTLSWWAASFDFWDQGTPREMYTAIHTTSDYSPIGGQVKADARKELPPPACFRFSIDASDVNPAISENSLCFEAKLWAREFTSWYPRYLLSHPIHLAEMVAWAIPRSISNYQLTGGTSLIPQPISEILLGSNIPTWPGGDRPVGLTDPRVFYDVILFIGLASPLLLFFRRKISNSTKMFVMISLAALAVAAAGTVTLPTSPGEISRIGTEANVAYRIVTMLVLFELLQSQITARRNGVSDEKGLN